MIDEIDNVNDWVRSFPLTYWIDDRLHWQGADTEENDKLWKLYVTAQKERRQRMKTIMLNTTTRNELGLTTLLFEGCNTETTDLPVGDIWYINENGDIIIVKYLNITDLRSMIFNKSLFELTKNIVEMTKWGYIILTGQIVLDQVASTLDNTELIPAIKGALLTLQETGLVICFSSAKNAAELAHEAVYIINRDRNPVRQDPRRDYITSTDTEAILMSIPGIGPSKAAVLLDHCGNLAFALDELTDTSVMTPTITTNHKQQIRTAFGIEDGFKIGLISTSNDGSVDLADMYDQALEEIKQLQAELAVLKIANQELCNAKR